MTKTFDSWELYNNNIRCGQRRKSWHHEKSRVSVRDQPRKIQHDFWIRELPSSRSQKDTRFSPREHLGEIGRLLHSPNGSNCLPLGLCKRAVTGVLKNDGNSHRSHKPTMEWDTRQSHFIFWPTNHKRLMPANWRPCLIPHWVFLPPG